MQDRQLFVLSILLAGGALLTAIIPKHALFNAPGGTFVLGGMSALAAVAALLIRLLTGARGKSRAD
jgi:hypothetical protein